MVNKITPSIQERLLKDAIVRDRTTARRYHILNILWNERYLTRENLVIRVERILGKNCFGDSAWQDVFYRDMRIVREAFKAAGYQLKYSRRKNQRGYYLEGEPVISENLSAIIRNSIAEVDQNQIGISRQLSAAERFQQGISISNAALNAVAYRIQHRNPKIGIREAKEEALSGNYSHETSSS